MNILKALFGNSEQNPEEEKVEAEHKKFDLMKYDGVKAMKMGQFEYALRCFDEALKLKDDSEIRDYLSRVFIRLDRLDEALEQLQLMAVAEPDNTDVKLQMAHVCYMKEDYAAMSDAVEQALAVNGDLPQAHFMYAQSALKQGDVINGIARLTKAVALDDNYADARLLRAQTLLDYVGDVADFKRFPNFSEDLRNRLRAAVVVSAPEETHRGVGLQSEHAFSVRFRQICVRIVRKVLEDELLGSDEACFRKAPRCRVEQRYAPSLLAVSQKAYAVKFLTHIGEPLLELGIVLAEVVLPKFDVLIDALLEVVSIEEDELTRHDDESLRLIALESLEATIEQLNELAWIAGCRSIGEFASRVESDTCLSGVGNHETNLWLVSQSEECGVLSVRIERTADAVDAGEGVHLLAIETSLEIDMVEAVLCVEPVNHTTLDRLNNNYG